MADETDKSKEKPAKKPVPPPNVLGYEAIAFVASASDGQKKVVAEMLMHRVNTGMLTGDKVDALDLTDAEALVDAAVAAGVLESEATPRGCAKWARAYLARA